MDIWTIGKSATLTDMSMCINRYRMLTPGLYACLRVGVNVNGKLEYPDLMVMINSGKLKQCTPNYEKGYFEGPPNFIMDIPDDIHSDEIERRRKLFAVAGVKEYVIIDEAITNIEWNRLDGNRYVQIYPDENGLIKSSSLPGLWIPIDKLRTRDIFAVMASIDHGTTRNEHHQLMETIWKKGR
jgi:hypothetical protein